VILTPHHWNGPEIYSQRIFVISYSIIRFSCPYHTEIIVYLLTYGAEPFLRSCQLCSYLRTSQHFMEPEGSLPCSQELSTGPYPESDRSSPNHPILSKIHFNIATHLRLGLPSGLFPSGFPTNILYAFLLSPIRATFHVHLIFLDLIILIMFGKKYKLWSSSSCSFLQFPVPSSLFGQKILLSTLI
jgi:hypothetical protein